MGLLQRIERVVGRLNRWLGGAPAAAQAESPSGPTQVRTMAATDVAEDVDQATRETDGSASEDEREGAPPST